MGRVKRGQTKPQFVASQLSDQQTKKTFGKERFAALVCEYGVAVNNGGQRGNSQWERPEQGQRGNSQWERPEQGQLGNSHWERPEQEQKGNGQWERPEQGQRGNSQW
jgi:hypothetical protein